MTLELAEKLKLKYKYGYRLIFCISEDSGIENEWEYGDLSDWACTHLNAETVIPITEHEIYEYDKLGLWHGIADAIGGSMLGPSEDEWLVDAIQIQAAKKYLLHSDFSELDIVNRIIFVLDYALKYDKTVVFLF